MADKKKPMTDAERAKAYRLKRKQATLLINSEMLKLIDNLDEFFQLGGREKVISDLLEVPLVRAIESMQSWISDEELTKTTGLVGDNNRGVVTTLKRIVWREACTGTIPPQIEGVLKEIMEKKR